MARIPNFGKFKDTLSEAKKTVSAAASTAAETASKVAAEAKATVGEEASGFAAEAWKTAGEASRVVAAAATEAANSASRTINEAGQTVYDAFNKEETFEAEYEQVTESESTSLSAETNVLIMPNPVIDDNEWEHFRKASTRYEELLQPGAFKKTGETLSSLIPKEWKQKASQAQDKLSQQQLYEQTMKVLVDGFGAIEDQAARFSVSEEQILKEVNVAAPENTIVRLNQVCLARSYTLNSLVENAKNKNLAIALAEGATTGAAGFVGIPFNLVLSTFLYYRAVQSVAQYYGFDVKNDPTELVIAGEVFAGALNQNSTRGELTGAVAQLYTADGVLVPKDSGKGWHAITGEDGVPVVIQQLRTVSDGIAKRALEHASKEELEATLFKPIFEQVGRSLAQSTLNRSIPVFSAVFSAVFDTTMMNKIVDFANVFYAKRFILEKETRLEGLSNTVASVEVDVQ